MKSYRMTFLVFFSFLMPSVAIAETISVEKFVRFAEFTEAKLSPDGTHLAVGVPKGEQTGIAILDIRRFPKLQVAGNFAFAPNEHVEEIYWANNERVLFTSSFQSGTLNQPRLTGRLYAMDLDGTGAEMVYGTNRQTDYYFKYFRIIDLLPEDSRHILISSYAGDRDRPIAELLNIEKNRPGLALSDNSRTRVIARSPLPGGALLADSEGNPRFAYYEDDELDLHIAYRESDSSDWQRMTLDLSGDIDFIDFAADDRRILVDTETSAGMGIHILDPTTGELEASLVSDKSQPIVWLPDIDTRRLSGVLFDEDQVYSRFIDDGSRTGHLYRLLEKAFAGHQVVITSSTRQGDKSLVAVSNDRMSPDYYLFDTVKGKVQFLMSSRNWLNPKLLADRKPVTIPARDDVSLPGYLTLPRSGPREKLPMVVIVHGGPHGIRDYNQFDFEAQLLANRGYAVLQVNYRGSGGYSAAHETAGYRNWGTLMQDDLYDSMQWAVEQGIADPDRVCLYGASYGGYSVMQSLTRYPDTYQCGFAFVGVYDLPLMYEEGDISWDRQGRNYLRRILGTDQERLIAQSPSRNADRITAPVFIAHGKEDQRAHVEHYYVMTEALDNAEVDYESWLVPREGHGFYDLENRVELYEKLLEFLDEHIGT